MVNRTLLENLKELYNSGRGGIIASNRLSIEIKLTEALSQLVSAIDEAFPSGDISLSDNGNDISLEFINLHIGKDVNVQINVPRNESNFYAFTTDDFISSGFIFKTPTDFFLQEANVLKSEESNNEKLNKYLEIVGFTKFLLSIDCHDHTSKSSEEVYSLIFLGAKKKLYIRLSYIVSNITIDSVDVKNSTEFLLQSFSESLYKDEKVRLLRIALIDYLSSVPEPLRLEFLINNLVELCEIFKNNYELFLSEFSFKDELAKVIEDRREFMLKLNGVLTGIQAKVLAIPISFVIAGSQIKPVVANSDNISNFFILFGSFVFLYLMQILLDAQKSAVDSISREFGARRLWFLENLPSNYESIKSEFAGLEQRSSTIRKYLDTLSQMAWTSFVITTLLFSYYAFV